MVEYAEYIEREALKADIRESYLKLQEIYETLRYERERDICAGELGTFCEVLMRIKDFPAADVAHVVHGRWVDHMCRDWRCSECGDKIHKVRNVDGYCYADKPNYCPNCGARMDGE